MSIEALREEVIQTVREADERKLLLVKHVIEADESNAHEIPQQVMDEVDRRRQRYLRGEGKSYTPEEFMTSLRMAAAERGK